MIRIAAFGDVHFNEGSRDTLRPHLENLPERADVLLIAGDLTTHGKPDQAAVLADELRDVALPKVAVLGNHDHHSDEQEQVRDVMEGSGVRILEGEGTVVDVGGVRVGIAGAKGFGGGFAGACGSDFGEREMKAFVGHTKMISERLEAALKDLDADLRIVLLHYSPTGETLEGERLEIYPFLGSYLLAEPIDRLGADLVLHGHAHLGTEKGRTSGGIQVRNVAQPVIGHAYNVYRLNDGRLEG